MRQQNKDDYTTDIDAAAAVAAALSTAATTSLRAQSYSTLTRQLATGLLHKPRVAANGTSQYNLALMQQQQQQGQGHRLSAPPRTSTSTTMLGTSTNDSDLCTSESGSERSLREHSPPLIEVTPSSSLPVDAQTTSSCVIRRDQQTAVPNSLPIVGRLNADTRQKLFSTLQQLSTSHPYRHSSHSSSSTIDDVNSCSGDQLLVTTSPLNLSQSSAVKTTSHPFIADSSEGTYVP